MKFDPITIKDKTAVEILLRNAQLDDAKDLISYLDKTAEETPYTLREPGEVKLSIEEEEKIIQQKNDSKTELMLVAYDGEKHVGNCTLMALGKGSKLQHRCSVAIALYKEYWRRGIGKTMMTTVIDLAKRIGYEQMELDVICENKKAIALYESLGFEKCGSIPHCLKFKDGTYADSYMMVRKL